MNNPINPSSNTGLAVILSGPSGAGKSTICKYLFTALPSARFSVSCTTRQPRPGEINGVHYHFLTKEQFIARRDAGDFLEWAEVHGNFYGTLREAVVPSLSKGDFVILDIDIQGARQVRKNLSGTPWEHHFISVFCAPPTTDELEKRLRGRGTETEETIQKRLHNAIGELQVWREYDYLLINDNAEAAAQRLLEIIHVAGLRSIRISKAPWKE